MAGFFSKGESISLQVEGMSCQHCVAKVESGVKSLEGVNSVKVDLEAKEAKVQFDPKKIGVEEIKGKIVDVGYQVK